MLRRILLFWIALFILFFIVTRPATAAGFVHHWYDGVHDIATAVANFISHL